MKFSLIVATIGRSREVCDLLDSLRSQSNNISEVIIVDQNDDERISDICDDYSDCLPLRHVRSAVRESSHARNVGLALSSGDIVAFPDDDCTFPAGLLDAVNAHFERAPDLALLSGPAMAPSGRLGSGRWNRASGPLTMDNVWTSIIEFNLFIRRTALTTVGPFDEELGVGARFGSGEAADLAIRVMRAGYRTHYDTALRVVHPDKRLTEQAASRAFAYGLGLGRVLRRHHAVSGKALSFFIRPLGGVALGLVSRQPLRRRYYWQTFRGRLAGFLAPQEPARSGARATDARNGPRALPMVSHDRQ